MARGIAHSAVPRSPTTRTRTLARSWLRLRAHGPVAALTAVALAVAALHGSASLGGYRAAAGGYRLGAAVGFVAYHAADLLLLCGVIPACALALLFLQALRDGERSPAARAYLAISVSFTVWFVLEVGVFASAHAGRIEERDLISLTPLLFLGCALWLSRGAPRSYLTAASIAFAAAALLLTLPYRHFVTAAAAPDSFTFAACLRLLAAHASLSRLLLIGLPAAALATSVALLPRRLLTTAVLLVLAAFAGGSVAASEQVQCQSGLRQRALLGPERRWIDAALAAEPAGAVAYVYTGNPDFTAAWTSAFWNRSINRIDHPPRLPVGGPVPKRVLRVGEDGLLRRGGRPIRERYLVVPVATSLVPVGKQLATAQLVDASGARQTLALWRLQAPPRVLSRKRGFQPNGDLYGVGTVEVYDCAGGSFVITLLDKTTETVTLLLNGTPVAQATLRANQAKTEIVHGRPAAGSRSYCRLSIRPSSPLGTTQLYFAPG